MTHLTFQLVRADLRSAPGRAAAVAVLLGAACLLPSVLSTSDTAGSVLAFTIAFAASSGAIALYERRGAVLALNGGRRSTEMVIAAASMFVPGVAGAAGAVAVGTLLEPGPGAATIVAVALGVPMLAAPVAVWTAGRARPVTVTDTPPRPKRRLVRSMRVAGSVALVLLAGALSPALVPGALAVHLTTASRRRSRVKRWLGVALSLGIVVVATMAAGGSRTWSEVAGVLFWLGPGVIVAVAVLGTAFLDGIGALAARVGPRARIAITPLTSRGRSLGPIVGILAVVTSLGVMEGTVGASFGQREDDRERTLPTVTAPAGASADQAIVAVPPVDVSELRRVATDAAAGTGTRAVVIEQLGVGGTETFSLFGRALSGDTAVQLADDGQDPRPRWLGVVEPADLRLLGLEASAPDLAAGKVVVRGTVLAPLDGEITITTPGGTTSRAVGVAALGSTGGTELPGALVSRAAALEITDHLLAARVVVVPEPGRTVEPVALREVAATIGTRVSELPVVELTGMSTAESLQFDLQRTLHTSSYLTVHLGDEQVVVRESGPLNDVPLLSGSRNDGRDRLLGLGALAALMTVAVVVLAIGATRAEDEVLRVQGAPELLRSAVGALQAAVLAGSAAILAAMVGIGMPAAAFRLHNAGSELPDIPLVVPGEVAAQLIVLPLLVAGLTALFALRRHPSEGSVTVPVDDLAW